MLLLDLSFSINIHGEFLLLAQKNGYGETVESCDKKRQVGSANLMDKNAMA